MTERQIDPVLIDKVREVLGFYLEVSFFFFLFLFLSFSFFFSFSFSFPIFSLTPPLKRDEIQERGWVSLRGGGREKGKARAISESLSLYLGKRDVDCCNSVIGMVPSSQVIRGKIFLYLFIIYFKCSYKIMVHSCNKSLNHHHYHSYDHSQQQQQQQKLYEIVIL